jgi:mannose-1-phosphate guanylyltransferase
MYDVQKTQVAILAGGLGTRLRPFTETVPKPMIDINEKPFLEYKINQLKSFGVRDIVICTGYLGNKIEEYFKNGKKFGVNISYSPEEKPLGTAGAIKNAESLIKTNPFILMNGDTYLTLDLNDLFSFHVKKGLPLTLAVSKATNPTEQELVKVEDGILSSFYKRGTLEHAAYIEENPAPLINTGVYVFSKEILKLIPPKTNCSLEKDIFPSLAGNIAGFLWEGYMKDLANIQFCNELAEDLLGGKVK